MEHRYRGNHEQERCFFRIERPRPGREPIELLPPEDAVALAFDVALPAAVEHVERSPAAPKVVVPDSRPGLGIVGVLVFEVGAAGGAEHPAGEFAAVIAGQAALCEVREHPRQPVVGPSASEVVRAPAVTDLVVVPDHVGGEAVEHPADAFEPPVAPVDVPIPASQGVFVGQQTPGFPPHGAVQLLPDVEGRNSVGIALIPSGDDQVQFVLVAAQRRSEEVPHVEIRELRALSEQSADPVGQVAREKGELEAAPLQLRRRRAEAAEPVVPEEHPRFVPGVDGVPVPGIRIEPIEVEDVRGVRVEVPYPEIEPAGRDYPALRLLDRERRFGERGAESPPRPTRSHCLAAVIEEEREVPGAAGAHPEPHRFRGRVSDDRPTPEPRIRPRPVRPEDEGIRRMGRHFTALSHGSRIGWFRKMDTNRSAPLEWAVYGRGARRPHQLWVPTSPTPRDRRPPDGRRCATPRRIARPRQERQVSERGSPPVLPRVTANGEAEARSARPPHTETGPTANARGAGPRGPGRPSRCLQG